MAKMKLILILVFACIFALPAVAEPLVMVVMDPLSGPLSCDCVRGYAQRDYAVLADHIEQSVGSDVEVHWFESLAEAIDQIEGPIDLVIGKDSVVRADAKATGLDYQPRAALTGKDGSITQSGMIVVRASDNAKKVEDLAGYRLLFGPTDAAEKSSAVEEYFEKSGVDIDRSRKRFGACSEAVSALMRLPADESYAAVISSYAEPLLGGCGVVKKGDLRVVAETDPVPFITAFFRADLPMREKRELDQALLLAGTNPQVLTKLETLAGFVPYAHDAAEPSGSPASTGEVKKKIPES